MRLLVVILITMFLSCSRHDSGSTSGIGEFQQTRDQLCHDFIIETVPRCDRATFHVLMAAVCPGMLLPVQYEYPSGKWNRDVKPCYPEDSASETSRDTYLSLVLSGQKDAIQRAVEYQTNGDTGEPKGFGQVGNISVLLPIMRSMLGLRAQDDATVDSGIESARTAFSGHRGHLLAGYLWAVARLRGGLTVAGTSLLKELHDETPDSPYISSLFHRYSVLDNDQSGTLDLLRQVPHTIGDYGWGSSPWEVHYALTVSVLEGKMHTSPEKKGQLYII